MPVSIKGLRIMFPLLFVSILLFTKRNVYLLAELTQKRLVISQK
jgi:hypothetical protein